MVAIVKLMLLYAQKFIQNLPKEFTLADFESILYGKVNTRISFQKLSLHEPYRLLTPRMLDMDKFIEQSWKEEIRKRYGSSEKEEVKEEVKEEENNISLHIVEKKKRKKKKSTLRDEEDEDVKYFKSKMQLSPEEEEGEKNSENKENDLKSSEEVAIISKRMGKVAARRRRKGKKKKNKRRICRLKKYSKISQKRGSRRIVPKCSEKRGFPRWNVQSRCVLG